MLNHVPLLGLIVGFLLLAWGALKDYEHVQNSGMVILAVTALIALPVYLTGEPAEEVVEHLPGVSEQIIELHEDSALLSLVLAIAAGILAFVTLVTKRFTPSRIGIIGIYACLFFSLVGGASMTYTANLGGQIRHSEIRGNQPGDPEVRKEARKSDEENDD
jgi:hypothetical protein